MALTVESRIFSLKVGGGVSEVRSPIGETSKFMTAFKNEVQIIYRMEVPAKYEYLCQL